MTITPHLGYAALALDYMERWGIDYLEDMQNGYAMECDRLADGWEFLGAGCYRAAFKAPDGLVYKVNDPSYESNREEYTNYVNNSERVPVLTNGKVRFAECALIEMGDTFVMCMEYVEIENRWNGFEGSMRLTDEWEKIVSPLVDRCIFTDISFYNCGIVDGTMIVWDFTH